MTSSSLKIVLVGNQGVGKSYLCHSLITCKGGAAESATCGVEIHPYSLNGTYYNLWDIGGNPILWESQITIDHLKNADAVIIVKGGIGKSEEEWYNICKEHYSFIVDERPNIGDVKEILRSFQ